MIIYDFFAEINIIYIFYEIIALAKAETRNVIISFFCAFFAYFNGKIGALRGIDILPYPPRSEDNTITITLGAHPNGIVVSCSLISKCTGCSWSPNLANYIPKGLKVEAKTSTSLSKYIYK